MIITARQLEDLHRGNGSNGHVTLPYRARLSPLAQDWVKARKVVLGYADVDAGKASNGTNAAGGAPAMTAPAPPPQRVTQARQLAPSSGGATGRADRRRRR